MNRVVIQSGYSLPSAFAGAGKRKRRSSKRRGGPKKQQNKMKSCAASWKRSGKRGKYTSFMKSCLKK